MLDLQQELLLFEFRAVRSDLLYLASQATLKKFIAGDVAAREDLESEYVSFTLNKSVYDQIRYLDATGQEIVRVNYRNGDAEVVPQDALQSKATRYYYQQAALRAEGEVFVSSFDLNVERGQIQRPIKPVIRFLTPVIDEAGKKQGLLVLNYLGAHLLSQLKQIAAGFRGETMLLNSEGQYLQAPDPSHEWGWLLNHEHSFVSEHPLAWEQGRRLDAGQLRVGSNLLTLQRVSPGDRSTAMHTRSTKVVDNRDASSLILASYVTSSVANAHSKRLLNKLLLMHVGVMAVVALLSLYWARSGVVRQYHERRIAESESRLRQLSSRLLAAQETERRNLSRDLHDELGQQVTAIGLDLRRLAKKDGKGHPDSLLQQTISGTDQLLRSLHEIAARVRPSVLDDLGLQDAVESFLSEYRQRTGVSVTSQLRIDDERIPPTVGENVYRILQEALANVATHADVDVAEIAIDTDNDMLRMTVQDRGVGIEPRELKESARLGILGMRERAELLQGRFDLESTPGRGTQIRVEIPLREV